MAEGLTSIHGRKLAIAKTGNLTANGIDITQPCADASITVGAENTNVRAITIQLKDANGDAFVTTGGSTGIAIGTDGALLTVVAKKYFVAISEADGDIDLTWTDTGTEAAYLAVRLPNGRLVISAAMTNT